MRAAIALLLPLLVVSTAQAQRLVTPADPTYNLFSAAMWTSEISKSIRTRWRQPVDAAPITQPVIDIQIDRQGKVTGARVETTSGNVVYDASVVHAIRKASPLPMPRDRATYAPQLRIAFQADRPMRILPVGFVPGPRRQMPAVAPPSGSGIENPHAEIEAQPGVVLPAPDGGYPTVSFGTTPAFASEGRVAPPRTGVAVPAGVEAGMAHHRNDFLDLLNRFVSAPPGVRGGTLDMKITLDPQGNVSNVEPSGETLHNPALEHAIFAKVREINFGPQSGGAFTYHYQLQFWPPVERDRQAT